MPQLTPMNWTMMLTSLWMFMLLMLMNMHALKSLPLKKMNTLTYTNMIWKWHYSSLHKL